MRKLVDAVKLILLQDLHAENLIYARDPHNAVGDLAVQEGRAYFIDFGISKRFPPLSGFTNGTTTTPFEEGLGHYPPPEGIEAVNPYAYDMYCMGWVIRHISWVRTFPLLLVLIIQYALFRGRLFFVTTLAALAFG